MDYSDLLNKFYLFYLKNVYFNIFVEIKYVHNWICMHNYFTFEPFTGKAGATVRSHDSKLISSCAELSKSLNFSSSNIAICILCLINSESMQVFISTAVPNNFGS